MKTIFRLTAFVAASAIASCGAAFCQTAILPEPIVTVAAGVTLGSGNAYSPTTGCPNVILNSAGVNTGDGCPPTQALLGSLSAGDVEVDNLGNIYIAEQGGTIVTGGTSYVAGYDIRVIYNAGAALAAALIAANPQATFTPTPGRIYTLAGGLTGNISAVTAGSPAQTLYHCGSVTSPSSPLYNLLATDTEGDGCPAALTRVVARGFAIDKDGNIITTHVSTKLGLRVIYMGGTQMANLIKLLDPAVLTPQVGYIYQLGFNGPTGAEGDGGIATLAGTIAPRYVAVDSQENIYVSDGQGFQRTGTGAAIVDGADNVRMINGTTGIVTTVAGVSNCGGVPTSVNVYTAGGGCGGPSTTTTSLSNGSAFGFAGDGGPATSALLNSANSIFLDSNNNLFILDLNNQRVRVVYRGGTLAPLVNQGITPVVGNIYTYAGGAAVGGVYTAPLLGTLQVDGTPAQNILFSTSIAAAGIDRSGNVYVYDNGRESLWRIDAVTGIGNIIGGAFTPPANGGFCSGSSGPKSTDNFGNGCPALQSQLSGEGRINFDQAGNFYMVTGGSASSGEIYVAKFSYNNQFPATAVGSSVTQPMAFTADMATMLTGRGFSIEGAASGEFSDAGGTSCTPAISEAVKATCVVNVKFTPADAGVRKGQIQFNAATGVVGSEFLAGTGTGADLAIDNGTISTLGTGLTPTGVGADLNGNVYVADSKTGQVWKGAATGTALTPLFGGLKNPGQVAVDHAGNVYVADTGNNRVLVTTSTGATLASLGSGLSGPQGVAVDAYGNIFVADTGNNRIVQVTLNGAQYPVAFDSLATALAAPTQLGFDAAGDFFILDSGNQRLVESVQSTGIAAAVSLDPGVVPAAFAIDNAGDIYIADNTSKSVLNYSAGATPGFVLIPSLLTPVGLAVDADANLFVADSQATGAIESRRSLANIVFPDTTPGMTTNAAITANNVGNQTLSFTAPLAQVNNPLFSVSSSITNGCGTGVTYAPGSNCNFNATFSPLVPGNDSAVATFSTNAVNGASAGATLTGQSMALSTQTSVTLAVVPAFGIFYSAPITLKATLNGVTTTPIPGTFTLTVDGKTEEPPVAIGSSGSYSFVVQEPFGKHQLTVTYSGGGTYQSSSAAVSVTVSPAVTATSLTVTPQSINGIADLQFTSVVSVVNQTAVGQTGTVTIWSGPVGTGTVICSGPINANNSYTLSCNTANTTPPTLNFANNSFTAVYSGSANGNFQPSTSTTVVGSTSDFVVAPYTSSFTVPQGGVGQLEVNLVALFGSAGTVTASCTGLPANSVCRFTPVQTTLTSNEAPEAVLVQVYTDVSSTLASNDPPHAPSPSTGRYIALACSLPLGLLLLCGRRRPFKLLAMLLVGIVMTLGISSCGSSNTLQTFSTLQTATGTYNLTLTFTGSNGLTTTHSVPTTFTVLPYSPPY